VIETGTQLIDCSKKCVIKRPLKTKEENA